MLYDAVLSDFVRLPGETDDSPRIQRAIDAASGGVLFIPKGIYDVASPLFIKSYTSLELHPSAVLRAVADLDFILTFDAKEQTVPKEGMYRGASLNMFIKGGIFDADGMADCMHIANACHMTLSDITYTNPRNIGLMTGEGGYELIAKNLYVRTYKAGLAGNTAFYVKMGDSHFTDCIVVDCTVGFDIYGGSSRFTRCHVWGGMVMRDKEKRISEYLESSVAFRISDSDSNEHTLRDCYADTSETGFEIHDKARLLSCSYYNNPIFKLDKITVIDHRDGDYLNVEDCFFRIIGDEGVMYAKNPELENPRVVWGENRFSGGSEYTEDGMKIIEKEEM